MTYHMFHVNFIDRKMGDLICVYNFSHLTVIATNYQCLLDALLSIKEGSLF